MKLIVDETQLKIIPGIYEISMNNYHSSWCDPAWYLDKNLQIGILAEETLKKISFPVIGEFQDKEIKSNYSGTVNCRMFNDNHSEIKAEYEMYFLFGKLMHITGKVKNDGIIVDVDFPPLFEYVYDANAVGGVKSNVS